MGEWLGNFTKCIYSASPNKSNVIMVTSNNLYIPKIRKSTYFSYYTV